MKTTTTTHEENYARFASNPKRIDGAVNNTAKARLGAAFNYSAGEQIDAVEMAFASEPHGNMRTIMVVDMAAARSLRDQLNTLMHGHEQEVRRARLRKVKTYRAQRADGRTVRVTIPEDER